MVVADPKGDMDIAVAGLLNGKSVEQTDHSLWRIVNEEERWSSKNWADLSLRNERIRGMPHA